ncbi:hypothetical protein HYALB_00001660 [Hymenoscyphus albidus]|uniref:N-acetyltransferase domain-containing protein n=1 Tax=Hymenoscyphus albidus TaxID=595503 RepID=A0A9N9LGP6_9HELO|nr:hypothetical protein HYALB_00001660 [Hymenoscyphus albidus]
MSKLILLPAEPSDAAEMLAMQAEAFGGANPDPFWEQLFPVKEEKERAVKRFLEGWLGDGKADYVKVVDGESGKIISTAKWTISPHPQTESEMHSQITIDYHPEADTNEWSSHVLTWIRQHRLTRTKGGPCAALELMASHPLYQKRGAGTMAVKWGTDRADALGLACVVEATDVGRALYEKCGFVEKAGGRIVAPVPERWRGRPVLRFWFYEREVGGEREGERDGDGGVKESQ